MSSYFNLKSFSFNLMSPYFNLISRYFNLKSFYFNLNSFYFNLRVKRCSPNSFQKGQTKYEYNTGSGKSLDVCGVLVCVSSQTR